MGFVGVYTAVYDYQPQAQGELEIREGDLLYVLENSGDDDWWKAKKKADPEEDEEPVGLVPNNYVKEAKPVANARALYDYTRQTDEEVSFSEDAGLFVYDISDPDWTLVGINSEFGFAPANYIEVLDEDAATRNEPEYEPEPPAPVLPQRPVHTEPEEYEEPEPSSATAIQSPAAAIAGILHRQHGSMSSHDTSRVVAPLPAPRPPPPPAAWEEDDEEEPAPALPRRPPSQPTSPVPVQHYEPSEPSPPSRPQRGGGIQESPPFSPGTNQPSPATPSGYHIYNISEMISVMGKRKKMPTTLGINVRTGTIFISPEGSDEHTEWTADKLSHYSIEGKHVFLDLLRPSRSIDFHAGAKDTAREIVSALGEIAGAYKAEGLREVIAASQGGYVQKQGQILYDFMAQGDDEVTVAVGDEVIVLDDIKSEEWWMVRRLKNGREGVVPSSYVEITGIIEPSSAVTGINAGLSSTDQNRLDEERLAKEAAKKSRTDSVDTPRSERHKREKSDKSSSSKKKPDTSKTRNWVDRTGTFTVEAQFIGLHDGKIHLHKLNGIKIAVPVAKMSVEDLEYVEKVTGESLDEDKPLSDIRRRSQQKEKQADSKIGGQVKQSDHDWFDFFLKAGVGPHLCERYAQNFAKDSMDEAVLPDITPETLRTLGLKEGDILRVMRHLDNMFNRTGSKSRLRSVSFGGEEVIGNGEDGSGGLFSGPGGALRNNTRKGRPAPAVQTNDVVDPKAFELKDTSKSPVEKQETPLASVPPPEKRAPGGFDDDAWDIKPAKQEPATSAPATAPTTAAAPTTITEPTKPAALSGALADLSLLQAPLQPTPAQPTQTAQPTAPIPAPPMQPQQTAPPAQAQQPQTTGANPNFFAQLGPLGPQQTGAPPVQGFTLQPTGYQQPSQILPPRQRPQPPLQLNQNSLLPPPPQRPLSAPQDFQQSQFAPPPLQPQLTGLPHNIPQIAPLGQSLTELNRQRFQQSQFPQHLQSQPTGFAPQFQNGLMPQPTGFGPQPGSQFGFQQQQPYGNPQIGTGPFADPRPGQQFPGLAPQPTGLGGFSAPPQQPVQTGINNVLPPALQPQPTGINGYGTSFSPPPVPPIPQQPTLAPLQPQKTGPAPPVRFGVKQDAKKLTPQPTGMRANLAQATPSNPFGF